MKQNLSFAGILSKTHGVKGGLIIRNNFKLPEILNQTELVFIEIDKQPVPFFINDFQSIDPKNGIIQFRHVHDINKAKNIQQCNVFIESTGQQTQDANYYDFIGYKAFELNQGEIGVVHDINDNAKNPFFIVKQDTKEYYIPIQYEFIRNINTDEHFIVFDLPEGLLELF
jgi:16S rRNA processing protein RimM